MNTLIIGNADSIFIKNIIHYTLADEHHKITILTPSNSKFADFYWKLGVRICQIESQSENVYKSILHFSLTAKKLLYKEKFDIIHIHYVSFEALITSFLLKSKTTKCIASFWGSDLFRTNRASVLLNTIWLHFIDTITLTTAAMYKKFYKDYGHKFDHKLQHITFGNAQLDMIASLKTSNIIEKRKALNLPDNKLIFAIGYNKSPAQQHLKVLEQIASLSKEIQQQMHIVLRLTYGIAPDSYLNSLSQNLKTLDCTYTLYTEFMSEEQLAVLELCTDVFVHAQITDAFSATVQEHLFAGSLVMNPTWIQYHELKEASVFYQEYSNFNELKNLISNYIQKKENYDKLLKNNASKIYSISSWKSVMSEWKALYK